MRRLVRLPPVADGRRAAGDRSAGRSAFSRPATPCGVPVVARGAGTGLSGGALPLGDGVLLSLARFISHHRDRSVRAHRARAARRAQSRDIGSGRAVRACITRPIRRSQIACTIGGNVAENSGGVHCLKYGLTVHNVLQVRAVHRSTARSSRFGSDGLDCAGLRPAGADHRLRRHARRDHRSHGQAAAEAADSRAVHHGGVRRRRARPARRSRAIIAAGIIPAGLEMMDKPAIARGRGVRACRLSDSTPRPSCCASPTARREEVAEEMARMNAVLQASGATRIRVSRDEAERLRFWAGRKARVPRRRAASRPTTTAWTARFRAARCRDVLRAIDAAGSEVRPALRERVPRRRRQPASADPVRRQQAGRAARAPSSSAPRSSSCASRSAARSPASTASASRRSTRCACSSPRPSSTAFTASRRVRSDRRCSIRARPCRRCIAAPSSASMHVHARPGAIS